MVNIKKFNEIIKKENQLPQNYPYYERDIWNPMVEALGEDEDDIIEFMDNADRETLDELWSIYDDLMDKFPSKKMHKAISRFLKNYHREFDT